MKDLDEKESVEYSEYKEIVESAIREMCQICQPGIESAAMQGGSFVLSSLTKSRSVIYPAMIGLRSAAAAQKPARAFIHTLFAGFYKTGRQGNDPLFLENDEIRYKNGSVR